MPRLTVSFRSVCCCTWVALGFALRRGGSPPSLLKHFSKRHALYLDAAPFICAILPIEPRWFNSDEANLKPKELSAAWVLFMSGLAYNTLLFYKNPFGFTSLG